MTVNIYKKWHKTGFISIALVPEISKVIIDIGTTESESSKKLKQSVACYVNLVPFVSWYDPMCSQHIAY